MRRDSLVLAVMVALLFHGDGGFFASEAPLSPSRSVVEGVLWHLDGFSVSPELAAGKDVVFGSQTGPLTDVRLFVKEVGNADVHLPTEALKKLAREYSGRLVKVTGEIRYTVVVSKWWGDDKFGKEIMAPKGRKVWVPNSLEQLPNRRPVIWASGIEAIGPKAAPWFGPPVVEEDGRKVHTFRRLPKSSDIYALKLSSWPNASLPGLKPLTLANFAAMLDKMKPIRADDEDTKLGGRAPWYDGRFETADGEFQFRLYLGGNGTLATPDLKAGWVSFEHPKE